MEEVDEKIKSATDKLKDKLSPKDLKLQKEALEKVFKEGLGVYEAVGVSEESLEFMYTHGYNLYKSGKYDDAIQIFQTLSFLNGNDGRFTYALAASYQMKKQFDEALVLYLACQVADRKNPVLMWHIASCYEGLGKKMNALLCLRLCARYAGEDSEFESLKIRAEGEAATLEKEVDEEFSKETKSKKNKSKV